MNEETKKRISDINNGIIPDGYKKTKVGIVPVEWEEIKFSKAFSILKNNTLSRAELNDESGKYLNIHYGDILVKFNTICDCKKENIPYINNNIDLKNVDLLINGDIIIADTAEDNTVGKVIEIINIDDKNIVAGLHTIPCRPNQKYSQKWLGYYMDSCAFHNQLIPIITGIKVSSISKSEIQKTYLIVPPLPEQQKIAEILSAQDKLISLLEKKTEKLKELKKAYLQKMFPQKGSKYPELRFNGFTEPWEKRKVGDIVKSHNAGIYISKENYGSGVNIIGVGNIYDSDCVDGEIYRFAPVDDERFILDENDLIYGESSLVPEGIARTMYVTKKGSGTAFAWHTRRVKIDTEICNSHIATLELNYKSDVRNYLMKASTQTALTGMTTEGFFGATLSFPTLQEQEKISSLFTNLDNLIALNQRKLEKEKEKKKALMQLLLTGKVRVKT